MAEATRRYVQRRKQELGLTVRETFVPQVYDWGGEAQVDWYEAMAEIGGERLPILYLCDALDGEWRRVSRGLLSRHAAGFSGRVPAAKIRELAEGGYIERAEPVALMGECGTGKRHLRLACAWPRAGRNGGRDSPRSQTW